MKPPPARDPGLQPERTTLSWTRTASGLLLNGVLNLRVGFVNESLPLVGLSCMLLIAAAATFGFGRRRRLLLTTGRPVAPTSAAAAKAVMGTCLLAALAGLWSVAASHVLRDDAAPSRAPGAASILLEFEDTPEALEYRRRRKKQMCHRYRGTFPSEAQPLGDTFTREVCEANLSLRLRTKQIRHSVDAKRADRA